MKNKKLLNHEVLHTSSVLMEAFEKFIVEHTIVKNNKKLNKKAEHILHNMLEFYQSTANLK